MAVENRIIAFGKRFYEWLSQFGTVYRGVLPSGVEPGDLYLRFDGYADKFATPFIMPVQIYKHNTTSYSSVLQVAESIGNAISEGGVLVIFDDVRFKVDKGSPFYQDKQDEDKTVRAGYINLEITIY